MPPMPPCESSGLVDLCGVGAFITQGWFTLQVSNLTWYVVLVALIVLAIAIPFPSRALKDSGADGNDQEPAE
jgi:hypothetical protein